MDMESSLVVKVKYGDVLKRFRAGSLDLRVLRRTIIILFKFRINADLILSYVDEDGDFVSLDDDSELLDAVVTQNLNPLRINVELRDDIATDAAAVLDLLSIASASPQRPDDIKPITTDAALMNPWKASPFYGFLRDLPPPAPELGQYPATGLYSNAPRSAPPPHAPLTAAPLHVPVPEAISPARELPRSDCAAGGGASPGHAHAREELRPSRSRLGRQLRFLNASRDGAGLMNLAALKSPAPSNSLGYSPDGAGKLPYAWGSNRSVASDNRDYVAATIAGRLKGYNDWLHQTYSCDGCGMFPIIGPKYKSPMNADRVLCSTCFSLKSDEAAYADIKGKRYDQSFGQKMPSRFHDYEAILSKRMQLESCFIRDVTILDDTVMPPSTPFTKIWRMRNNGSVAWPCGTQLVCVGGDRIMKRRRARLQIPLVGLQANEEIDIAVDFVSPANPGRYLSVWKLASPFGQRFGQRVRVLIQVDIPYSSLSDINLNLPPEGSFTDEFGVIDANAEPLDENVEEFDNQVTDGNVNVVEPFDDQVQAGTGDVDPFDNQATDGNANVEPIDDQVQAGTGDVEPFDNQVGNANVEPLDEKVQAGTGDIEAFDNQVTDGNANVEQFNYQAQAGTGDVEAFDKQVTDGEANVEPFGDEFQADRGDVEPLDNEMSHDHIADPDTKMAASKPTSTPGASLTSDEPPVSRAEAFEEVENTLLKELEDMGFEQIKLNKKFLKLNDYDIERSVDDLCCFTEWDLLLEELDEMGFDDVSKNKDLLRKTGGSITQVVMDLLSMGNKEEDASK